MGECADYCAAELTTLSAATTGNELVVSWNATPGAISYNLKRSTNSGGPYTLITNLALPTFTDTNVSPDVIYYYVVSAVNGGGETTNSAPLTATLAAYWNNSTVGASAEIGTAPAIGSTPPLTPTARD